MNKDIYIIHHNDIELAVFADDTQKALDMFCDYLNISEYPERAKGITITKHIKSINFLWT